MFALIGLVCGVGGSLYVYVHRRYVLWMRSNKQLKKFLEKNRFIYPLIIASLISGLSFPGGLGNISISGLNNTISGFRHVHGGRHEHA